MNLIYTGSFEELEKFGMFHNPSSEVWLSDKDYQILTIDEHSNVVCLETIQLGFGKYKKQEELNNKALCILYDLISANLIKKEEE